MFYKLKKTLVAAALLPLAFGCKRETLTEQLSSSANSTKVDKVQQWLKNQPLPLLEQGRTAGNTLPKHTLQWVNAGYDAVANIHWVPAILDNAPKGTTFGKTYLVATQNQQGQITDGQYIVVLPNRKKMGDAISQTSYNPVSLINGAVPTDLSADGAGRPAGMAGFSGAVLLYSMAGQPTASRVYSNGQQQQGATAVLTAKPQPVGSNANKVPVNCDGPVECIDWYWQTYVDGVLVSEEYQFTTCPCGGSLGGSSGGPITNNESPCGSPVAENPAYQSFLSVTETNANPSAMSPSGGGSESQTEKRVPVTWKPIYGTWGYVTSIEEKVLEPYSNGNQYPWKFKAFEHKSHALAKSTGITLTPHNVELFTCSFTPNIPEPYRATMQAKGLLRFSFCGVVISLYDDNFDRTQSTYAW